MRLQIERLWSGEPAPAAEHVTLEIAAEKANLLVEIEAPFHGDPCPALAPGSTAELWNYEVVELFLFGDDERYLEIELGPHGHHLILELAGLRRIRARIFEVDYRTEHDVEGCRWRGQLRLPAALLPPGVTAVNAHTIHGLVDARRYLSAFPAPGARPDFHRREAARALDPRLRHALAAATTGADP